MSKRNPTNKIITPKSDPAAAFRKANNELHTIRVSTPILRVIERLVKDSSFRLDVTRRMTR